MQAPLHKRSPFGCGRPKCNQLTGTRGQHLSPRCTSVRASPRPLPVPANPEQMISQAVTAVEAAWRSGAKRQRLELLLPLIGATDLDDWPGGIRQQFKAASPLVESLLRQLKQIEGLQGPLNVEIWDQGDAVGAWFGDKLAAVLFPTASTLEQLRQLSERRPKTPELLLIINPQWELKGNLFNDFGFGDRKQRAMSLIDSFEYSYYVKSLRVYGNDVRILRGFPGEWQIQVVVGGAGEVKMLETMDRMPEYADIEAALRRWPESSANKNWVDRLKDELQWTTDSLKSPPGQK